MADGVLETDRKSSEDENSLNELKHQDIIKNEDEHQVESSHQGENPSEVQQSGSDGHDDTATPSKEFFVDQVVNTKEYQDNELDSLGKVGDELNLDHATEDKKMGEDGVEDSPEESEQQGFSGSSGQGSIINQSALQSTNGAQTKGQSSISTRGKRKLGSSRSPSPSPNDFQAMKPARVKTEGDGAKHFIHVGEGYQAPYLTSFFLNSPQNVNDPTYRFSCTPSMLGKIYYSQDDTLKPSRIEALSTACLVYSPYLHAQMKQKRIREGAPHKVVKNDEEMDQFIEIVASNWKQRAGWQPYSPEFAYKLLHAAQYDPYKALWLMNHPYFDFEKICDPPTRKYQNKWKPSDRRGLMPVSPFPVNTSTRSNYYRRQGVSGYMLR